MSFLGLNWLWLGTYGQFFIFFAFTSFSASMIYVKYTYLK